MDEFMVGAVAAGAVASGLYVTREMYRARRQAAIQAAEKARQDSIVPVVPVPGPESVYMRLHYMDGRVDVRKVKANTLGLIMSWRGRIFEAGEWTKDGHVYREVS